MAPTAAAPGCVLVDSRVLPPSPSLPKVTYLELSSLQALRRSSPSLGMLSSYRSRSRELEVASALEDGQCRYLPPDRPTQVSLARSRPKVRALLPSVSQRKRSAHPCRLAPPPTPRSSSDARVRPRVATVPSQVRDEAEPPLRPFVARCANATFYHADAWLD